MMISQKRIQRLPMKDVLNQLHLKFWWNWFLLSYDSFSQLKLAKKVLETAPSTKSKMARRVIPGDTTIRFETSEGVDVIPTFDAFNLRDDLLRGIYAYGKFEALLCSKSAVIFIERRPCMLHWPMHADRASLTLPDYVPMLPWTWWMPVANSVHGSNPWLS